MVKWDEVVVVIVDWVEAVDAVVRDCLLELRKGAKGSYPAPNFYDFFVEMGAQTRKRINRVGRFYLAAKK